MIVDLGLEPIGAWCLDLGEIARTPSDVDWERIGSALQRGAARLAELGALLVECVVVRTADADPAFELTLDQRGGLGAALAEVRALFASPLAITLHGRTRLPAPPSEVAGAIELEAHLAGRLQIFLKTRSDDWMPYSLTAAPQHETAKENATLLERALRGLEALYGVPLDFDSTTSYANVERYGLRNSVYANGEIVDYTGNLPS